MKRQKREKDRKFEIERSEGGGRGGGGRMEERGGEKIEVEIVEKTDKKIDIYKKEGKE